jgi:hypothetical protein
MNQRPIRHPSRPLVASLLVLAAAACDDDSGTADLDVGIEASVADGMPADAAGDADGGDHSGRFSFFVASIAAMQRLSGSQAGFGGDLRFGQPDGLAGADEICRQIAETSMPGSSAKGWRAFLSVTKGPDGNPVHAIDRVGEGPWYDRRGRPIAMNREELILTRPGGADPVLANDLPNEDGVPNHAPDGELVDNHDILTGSDWSGKLYDADWSHTCHDWTSAIGSDGKPRVGHSWTRVGGVGGPSGGVPDGGPGPMMPPDGGFIVMGGPDGGRGGSGGGGGGGRDPRGGDSWISSLDEAGCAPGVNLIEMGPPDPRNPTVGSGGGYGGIYCLALTP